MRHLYTKLKKTDSESKTNISESLQRRALKTMWS